jgi:hypothetical protein
MKQIRENVYQITHTEMGKPTVKGLVSIPDLGDLQIDEADIRFIQEMRNLGYEPTFFISKSVPLAGRCVVVARQEKA